MVDSRGVHAQWQCQVEVGTRLYPQPPVGSTTVQCGQYAGGRHRQVYTATRHMHHTQYTAHQPACSAHGSHTQPPSLLPGSTCTVLDTQHTQLTSW